MENWMADSKRGPLQHAPEGGAATLNKRRVRRCDKRHHATHWETPAEGIPHNGTQQARGVALPARGSSTSQSVPLPALVTIHTLRCSTSVYTTRRPSDLSPLPVPLRLASERVRVGDRHAQKAGCGRRAAAIDSTSVTRERRVCAPRGVGSLWWRGLECGAGSELQ
eukprot:scaffold102096_cov74-Phaeocystis_antarctica.AAC.2